MTVYVCDDDPVFAEVLETRLCALLQPVFGESYVKVCGSGAELLTLARETLPDVVFLDIDMPEMDGFTLAHQLRTFYTPPRIVFVTSLSELVFESFQHQPLWFLRKGYMEELPRIIDKLALSKQKARQMIPIAHNGETRMVAVSDIVYFEASGHYLILQLVGERIRYKGKLSVTEQELQGLAFARIHLGYLVNCGHIVQFGSTRVGLDNGEYLPISRSRTESARQIFMQYMRNTR